MIPLSGSFSKSPEWRLKLSGIPADCRGGSVKQVLSDDSCKDAFSQDLIRKHLAAAHDVEPHCIHITSITEGSVCVTYSIWDVVEEMVKSWIEEGNELQQRLAESLKGTLLTLVVVLPALGFDISKFDSRGDKKVFEGYTFKICGQTYHQPKPEEGWKRVGIRALGQHESDEWLHPFSHPGNWARAYHGMREPGKSAVPISNDGFKPSTEPGHCLYGQGVYVSKNS